MSMFAAWGWPQVIVASWFAMYVAVHTLNHGKPREGNFSGFAAMWTTLMLVAALHYGGFW